MLLKLKNINLPSLFSLYQIPQEILLNFAYKKYHRSDHFSLSLLQPLRRESDCLLLFSSTSRFTYVHIPSKSAQSGFHCFSEFISCFSFHSLYYSYMRLLPWAYWSYSHLKAFSLASLPCVYLSPQITM